MPRTDELAELVSQKKHELDNWFHAMRSALPIPVTGSVDVRDAGYKIAVVDTNRFPAGWHHVSATAEVSRLLLRHINRTQPGPLGSIHLLPEAHTRNQGYAANVLALRRAMLTVHAKVTLGCPALNGDSFAVPGTSPVACDEVRPEDLAVRRDGGESFEKPGYVLLNNDLKGSDADTEALRQSVAPYCPEAVMGWHRRSKGVHNALLREELRSLAKILGVDFWELWSDFDVVGPVELSSKEDARRVAVAVDRLLASVRKSHAARSAPDSTPTVFFKDDSGTYGMGVSSVTSGEELLAEATSSKRWDKMTYGKGKTRASHFILQEGVPTAFFEAPGEESAAWEPVVYCMDGEAVDLFVRVNPGKGALANLNTSSQYFITSAELKAMSNPSAKSLWKRRDLYFALAQCAMVAMAKEQLLYTHCDSLVLTPEHLGCAAAMLEEQKGTKTRDRSVSPQAGFSRSRSAPGRAAAPGMVSKEKPRARRNVRPEAELALRRAVNDAVQELRRRCGSMAKGDQRAIIERFSSEANVLKQVVNSEDIPGFKQQLERVMLKCLPALAAPPLGAAPLAAPEAPRVQATVPSASPQPAAGVEQAHAHSGQGKGASQEEVLRATVAAGMASLREQTCAPELLKLFGKEAAKAKKSAQGQPSTEQAVECLQGALQDLIKSLLSAKG